MATPRLGLVVEDKPTELSCMCMHLRAGTGIVFPRFQDWMHRRR